MYALGDITRDSYAAGGRPQDMLFTVSDDPDAAALYGGHMFEYVGSSGINDKHESDLDGG